MESRQDDLSIDRLKCKRYPFKLALRDRERRSFQSAGRTRDSAVNEVPFEVCRRRQGFGDGASGMKKGVLNAAISLEYVVFVSARLDQALGRETREEIEQTAEDEQNRLTDEPRSE